MIYQESDKNKILEACNDRLVDVISDFVSLTKRGQKFVGECPNCGKEMEVNPAKKIFKCFKCGVIGGNNAVSFLMKAKNKSFPEALEYLNHKFTIVPNIEPVPAKQIKRKESKSYCERMLIESGLDTKDVQASVFIQDENKTVLTSKVFRPGTVGSHFDVVEGDDVIIEYYDLEGAPIKYELKDKNKRPTGKFKEFFRVRYQFPEEHLDRDGKPIKYQSPWGSGNFLYIPEKIRQLYREKKTIERLFLQEGEKKAEKACKHGIYSVGLAGINNIAMSGKIPEDLIRIIQSLGVKEVVLLFDADWNEISNNIKINDSVDKRPRNFFYAAKNYKEYMRALKNRGIYIEIYIGHVQKNEKKDKGIDDLLSNSLKDNPDTLIEDINYLINEKNLAGKYVQLYKITSWTDAKLEELWHLNNPTQFAKAHEETLRALPEFRIGKHIWRFNQDGNIESAQPLEADEKFWEEVERVDRNGNNKPTSYEFRYGRCFAFLRNRGYGRLMSIDGRSFTFVHINHPTVRTVEPYEIRDFVTDFAKVSANEAVLEMLYKGGVQYLGPDKLSNLEFSYPNFEEPSKEYQRLYFKDSCWEIRSGGIKQLDYSAVSYNIWHDQKHDFPAALIPKPLIDVKYDALEDRYSYVITPAGEKCQYLQFLRNTSNFTWRKERQLEEGIPGIEITPDELYENTIHLISKMAAMGYMILSAKDRSVSRAVIAMDGKQSEVGQSNGRSGKSLVGETLKQILPTVYINGKAKDIESDQFLWDPITEKTKAVFIDDVRTNFSLEFLFAAITGDWNVNYKGGRRAIFPFNQSPKIYISTNHALNGRGSSFTDRQYLIAFSDYYNDSHKPKDDFGCLFFDDWDFEQWNLFWNLIANCVQIYLQHGVVQAPRERIEVRQLRQEMGETFLAWADEYFTEESKLNQRLVKKQLYDEYLKYSNIAPKYLTAPNFKNKIKAYCTWKGYNFNPHLYDKTTGQPMKYDKDGRPVEDDKAGGIEYFTIGTSDFHQKQIVFTDEDNKDYMTPSGEGKPF